VDNLITNKSGATFEASRGILKINCIRAYVLANAKKIFKTIVGE
jgi:hypothetical protein